MVSPGKSPPRPLKRPSSFIQRRAPGTTSLGGQKTDEAPTEACSPKKMMCAGQGESSPSDSYVSLVSKHYNELYDVRLEHRPQSKIFHVRQFNNWIKSVMIREAALKAIQSQSCKSLSSGQHPLAVLDMCCGRGGDLKKWQKSGISTYVGVDVAEESIRKARDRYSSMDRGRYFAASFAVADCFYRPLFLSIEPLSGAVWESTDAFQFDIVSCMFSFHYSFSTKSSAKQALENVSRHLRPGGMFIMTIPDAAVIRSLHAKALERQTRKVGNALFQIEFPHEDPADASFGSKRYIFSLEEAVKECPEFIVSLEELCPLASQVDLQLVSEHSFPSFYSRFRDSRYYQNLLVSFGILDRHNFRCLLTEEEWETVSLYCSLGFVKVQ